MTKNEAWEKFINFLLKRPCTRKQAYEYLQRQKISGEKIEKLIQEAENQGFIDDLTYAKLFAEGHLSWGNMKISYELKMRGVSRENINIALEESEDEITRAQEISESWKRSGLEERKIISRLLSRGFSQKATRYALR